MRKLIAASLVLAALGTLGWARATLADELQFAGRDLVVAPPPGFCALDPMRPQEGQMLEQQQKLQQQGSKLALMFLACADLEQLRSGSSINPQRYGTVIVLAQQGQVRAIGEMTRAQFIAAVAKPYPQVGLDLPRRLDEIARSDVNAFDAKVLGVLKQDDNAVYLGVAIRGLRFDGAAVPAGIVGVTAVTLINQLPVSMTLYQAKGNAEGMMALLSDQQRNVDALVAVNAPAPTPVPSPVPSGGGAAPASAPGPAAPPIDVNSPAIQVALIAGLAAVVAVAGALMLRRRRRPDGAPREPIPPT